MWTGDVKVSRIPRCSATPSLRPPRKAVVLSSDCSRSYPGYNVQNILCFLCLKMASFFCFGTWQLSKPIHLVVRNSHEVFQWCAYTQRRSQRREVVCGTDCSGLLCFRTIKLFSKQENTAPCPKRWHSAARMGLIFRLESPALVLRTLLTPDDKDLLSNINQTMHWQSQIHQIQPLH